jgi:hypothetical protein
MKRELPGQPQHFNNSLFINVNEGIIEMFKHNKGAQYAPLLCNEGFTFLPALRGSANTLLLNRKVIDGARAGLRAARQKTIS